MKKFSFSGKTIVFTVLLACVTAGLVTWAVIHWQTHSDETDGAETAKTTVVDMNDPTPGDYGKLYYAPIDEKHITEEDSSRFIDNEVLIVVKDGVSENQVRDLAVKYDAEIVGAIEISGDYQIRLAEVSTKAELESILQRLQSENIIDSASLNYVLEVSEADEEEGHAGFKYGSEWKWYLQNYNDCKGKSWGIEAINTMGAWAELDEHNDQVKPVRVGLIDTGFGENDDLGFAAVFYDKGVNGVTSNSKDHGTHVAGIMAAKANNNEGICGVYPYGDGLLYGVCNAEHQGAYSVNANLSMMAEKVSFAELIVRNVKVINTSRCLKWKAEKGFKDWYQNTSTDEHFADHEDCAWIIAEFLQRMLDKHYDFVIVSSAGNNSDVIPSRFDCRYSWYLHLISPEKYPEVYDRIIVVGALDFNLNITDYSDGGPRVDIYAPGGKWTDVQQTADFFESWINTFSPSFTKGIIDTNTSFLPIFSTLPDNTYGYMDGTSQAAPHVAGVAAMVWSANNSLNGAQVKRIILNEENRNPRCTSCNMVDAHQAVSEALRIYDSGKTSNPENGAIQGYVVERFHEGNKIVDANITLENLDTNELFFAHSWWEGHFEIMLPAGKYKMTVFAKGYETYRWPDEDNYETPIVVENGQIKYLDWIKLRRSDRTLQVYAYDKDTAEPITNKPIMLTVTNPDLPCAEPTQTLSTEDGSATFHVTTGKQTGYLEATLTLHIDGYKDYVFDEFPFDEKTADLQVIKLLFEKEKPAQSADGYINDEGYFVFGHYEQDDDAENGTEPIEWEILSEEDGRILLISRCVLDCGAYNKEFTNVTWAGCSLRQWLNDEFINTAFSENEKAQIQTVTLSNPGNPYTGVDGGADTQDRVFLLSMDEVLKYYEFEELNEEDKRDGSCRKLTAAAGTFYVTNVLVNRPLGNKPWGVWLRTPGETADSACYYVPGGFGYWCASENVNNSYWGIRPAMWISKDAVPDK